MQLERDVTRYLLPFVWDTEDFGFKLPFGLFSLSLGRRQCGTSRYSSAP